jgi:3-methyl-2-oxobutanoate hydroxymethyltransferase
MPFGSYEACPTEALKNAFRLVKEAGVDAVKLEGGSGRADTVKKFISFFFFFFFLFFLILST